MWWILALAVALVVLAAALSAYLTAVRLDRLHIRTDLAAQSLHSAFLRRHTVALAVSEALRSRGEADERLTSALGEAARASSEPFAAGSPQTRREQAENALTRALSHVPRESIGTALSAEAEDVGERLEIARRFYNDAVRDTRRLREKRIIALFHLAGSAAMPEYVEMLDPS